MKSVGEVMAIGRTFKEALMKAMRALETGKKSAAEDSEPQIADAAARDAASGAAGVHPLRASKRV